MERIIEYLDIDPSVAEDDQQRARALDLLRTAEHFVLCVPAEDEGEFAVRGIIDADVGFMGRAAMTIANSARDAWNELMRDAIREGLEREEEA